MRVLVIGGTGLLGQHIAAELTDRGHEVRTLARRAVPGGATILGDVQRLTEGEWLEKLEGFDAAVYATGLDDREVPRAPADRYFHEGNVEPLRRLLAAAARTTGCRRLAVCGSYFTALHHSHPEWRLAERHPYIRSRLDQAEVAAEHTELSVAVLEIPFVFGSAQGRRPMWAPAVPWLRSRLPLVAPVGGTAVTAASTVAQAAAGAVERGASGRFPVADANLSWHDLLARFAVAAGRAEGVTVRRLPSGVLRGAMRGAGIRYRLAHREPGLNSAWLPDLLLSELFVDESACRTELGVTGGDLDVAFRDTVTASARRPS